LPVLSEAHDNLRRPDNAVLTGILAVAVLYFARAVFVPLALAALIAFVLAAPAHFLERLGLRRTLAALCVILLSLAGVAITGWVLLGQVYNLAVEMPQYQQNIQDKVQSMHLDSAGKLSSTVEMLNGLNKRISGGASTAATVQAIPVQRPPVRAHAKTTPASAVPAQPVVVRIDAPQESMTELAGRTMTPLIHPLATTFLVVIFLGFMLIGREDLRDRGLKLAGSGRMHVTTSAIKDATRRVSRYLQMQLIVNLCYGAVAGMALFFIGVPHPLLWAVLTCVLRFVPYVGIMMAAAGPILLAGAVSPRWIELIATVVTYGVLEIVVANFVEPLLYGSSAGISALAVLIAAVFWTFLWGLPGLLLSTPLTVCLIVIGRQAPRLRYLEVLFGERTGLPPAEHFYQRLLSANTRDARALLETALKAGLRTEVFDTVIVPALTMIEEARHTGDMTPNRAEELLQGVEELIEDLGNAEGEDTPNTHRNVVFVPARDAADEIACQLAQQAIAGTAGVLTIAAGTPLSSVQKLVARVQPEVICVIGVAPRAVRDTKMRCHQMRGRFPESTVLACILGDEQDLSSLRSRIPTDDARHVVCSLQLMADYLKSVLGSVSIAAAPASDEEPSAEAASLVNEEASPAFRIDPFDGPMEGMFDRVAMQLARSLDAPFVLITAADGNRHFWESQCGLPEESLDIGWSTRECSICNTLVQSQELSVVDDTAEDERFANDAFLQDHGIRFCAVAPLMDHQDHVIGSLCVLDTRPRQMTDFQLKTLAATAETVMSAIEMSEPVAVAAVSPEAEVSSR
jgi:predicted PurR-regulated permease PerM/GAF domain-containing protein